MRYAASGSDRLAAFQEQLHITNGFLVDVWRGQILYARTETTMNVILQARARMKARQVDFARRNHKVAMNQVNDPIRQIGREVGP